MSDSQVYEGWRPVPGRDGYEASTEGHVRRLERRLIDSLGRHYCLPEVVLKPWKYDKYGHLAIRVFGKTTSVHSLVAAAFHGPRPKGLDIRHLNGEAGDNRPENLAYGTRIENCMDTIRHGRIRNGQKTHCIRGHEFTPENTYRRPGTDRPSRQCLACVRLRKEGAA